MLILVKGDSAVQGVPQKWRNKTGEDITSKMDLDMSLHYCLYLKKPITDLFITECAFRKRTCYGYGRPNFVRFRLFSIFWGHPVQRM